MAARRADGQAQPVGVSTCKDLVHGRDVEMIAAYFAPTWGMLKRIPAGARPRPRSLPPSPTIMRQLPRRASPTKGCWPAVSSL